MTKIILYIPLTGIGATLPQGILQTMFFYEKRHVPRKHKTFWSLGRFQVIGFQSKVGEVSKNAQTTIQMDKIG